MSLGVVSLYIIPKTESMLTTLCSCMIKEQQLSRQKQMRQSRSGQHSWRCWTAKQHSWRGHGTARLRHYSLRTNASRLSLMPTGRLHSQSGRKTDAAKLKTMSAPPSTPRCDPKGLRVLCQPLLAVAATPLHPKLLADMLTV